MPASWTFEDLGRFLRSRPAALEPDLRILDRSLEPGALGGEDEEHDVPAASVLCGEDAVGRPVLVLTTCPDAQRSCERLIRLASTLRLPGHPLLAGFRRPDEARVILIGEHFSSELLDRLRLLEDAIAVRCYLVTVGGTAEAPEPRFRPLRASGAPAAQLLASFDEEHGRLLGRFLDAAGRIQPPVRLQGRRWPMLLSGRNGPFACLHRDGELPLLAWLGSTRPREKLELVDEASVDLAIDVLLREQSDPILVREGA